VPIQITAQQCRKLLDQEGHLTHNADRLVILDVRTEQEYSYGHLSGSINLDFRSPSFSRELAELDRSAAYLLYCRTGIRSAQAATLMISLGFVEIYDLSGGITGWLKEGLPVIKE